MTHIDGNSAPDDIFTRDLTAADATCASCGASGPVAAVMVYESAGTVLRCPACDAVLMRIVQHGSDTCVEMRGVRVLRWRTSR